MKKFTHNSGDNNHIMFTLDFNLLEKAFKIGLWFLATTAGKYRALRNLEEPSLDNLALPLIEEPEVLCLGTRPA